jgi:SOS-response transcriptional repressor LexA
MKMSASARLARNLDELMKSRPDLSSQVKLASKTGIGQSTISRIRRGEVNATADNVARIAAAFGVTVGELYGEERGPQKIDHNVEPAIDLPKVIPLISWVQAGTFAEAIDMFAPGDAEDWLPAPRKCGPRSFALRVRGISMAPRYNDGDIIYVDPDVAADHGRRVIVRLDHEAEVTFKELVIEGSQMFLRPLNPDWPGPKLIQIGAKSMICGVVVGKYVPE